VTTDNKIDPRQMLEVLFTREHLPEGANPGEITDALRQSEAARRHFDHLALAARELEGTPREERSSFERSFGEASFFNALDTMLAQEQSAQHEPTSTVTAPSNEESAKVITLSSWFKRSAPGLAAAAALLFSLLAISGRGVQQPPLQDDGFQARSATSTDSFKTVPEAPALALFCVTREENNEVVFRGENESPFGVLACSKDGELKLAHKAPEHPFTHIAVFGVDRRGELKWYGPSPASRDAVEISEHKVAGTLHPVGESIRLGVNHKAGKVRVHALFSNQPLDYDRLEVLLDRKTGEQLFNEVKLDLADEGISTTSKTFDVTEAKQ
jgi:hypothetical protein